MSVIETNSLIKFKGKDNSLTVIYPITKAENVDGLNEMIYNRSAVTTGNGSAYEATVNGISELTVGVNFIMIPHVESTSVSPSLNVNGLGSAEIRRRISTTTNGTVLSETEGWLAANQPVEVMYNGEFWIADTQRPSVNDLVGSVPVNKGGTGASTAEIARYNLGAVSMVNASVTLSATAWSSNEQTVSVIGVSSDNTVIPGPAPTSHTAYAEAGVYCSAQATNSLTFVCENTPSEDLLVNVVILT